MTPVNVPPKQRELRCKGCGQLLGFTTRPQPVPAQCTDVWCAAQPAMTSNEVRDSFIEHLYEYEEWAPEVIGEIFGLTRQRVQQVLQARTVC